MKSRFWLSVYGAGSNFFKVNTHKIKPSEIELVMPIPL
jgi:hypothetical protein